MNMKIGHWSLIILSSFCLGYSSLAYAMGGPAPKKEEPKYKLEIMKMEVVTMPAQSVLKPTKEGESKYKLEILKMDVITAPSPSWEGKKEKK